MARLQACVLVLAFSALMLNASASLMAVDLGSEFLKVSLVKPGKVPIAVVVNEMSKRKTPAMVGFVKGERLLGEEVAGLVARFPLSIFQRSRDLLGKYADDPTIAAMIKNEHLPYSVVEHPTRKTAAVKLSDGTIYSAEELVASILHYAKEITQAQAGFLVLDTVIAVPSFFSQSQRQAVIDAAGLAGLNVLGLINSHSAAALQFGIERNFENNTQTVVLYDIGSGSTEVTLVKYSTYSVKEGGRPKVYSQFEVKDAEWDSQLGGNSLDALLVSHFGKLFMQKHPSATDIFQNPKSMAKLKKQVRRTKEMLSANSMAPCTVEEVHDGLDFSTTITREAFEELAGDFFDRAARPLLEVLRRNNLTGESVDAVELLGGGSRVPRLRASLSEALGGRTLDRHLDADEAVVMGAGLFAANLSTSFRLRKFGMTDTAMFGVLFQASEVKTPAGADTEAALGVKDLLPYHKKLPSARNVHYHNLTGDPIKFSLSYNTTTPHGLPPGVSDPHLAAFHVSGIASVIDQYNTSGTVSIKFEADMGGVLRLVRAEAKVEVEVMEEKYIEVPADNSTANGTTNSTDSATPEAEKKPEKADKKGKRGDKKGGKKDKKAEGAEQKAAGNETAAGNATEAVKVPEKVLKKIMVPKKTLVKVPLSIAGPGWKLPPLEGKELEGAQQVLREFIRKESIKRETAAAKNALESYIIATRDSLESHDALQQVTTEDMRSAFSAQLTDMEDWLYMDGDAESSEVYRRKLKELQAVGDPMMSRKEEWEARQQLDDLVQKALSNLLSTVDSWAESKPWINESEAQGAREKVEEVRGWYKGQVEAQSKKKDYEEPAFKVLDVLARVEAAQKAVNKVNSKRKPRPPPPEVTVNGTTNGTANGTANGTTEGGAAGDKEGAAGDSSSSGDGKSGSAEGAGGGSEPLHDEL